MLDDRIFVDSSGLVALMNKDDALHLQARTVFANLTQSGRRFVTSDLIIAETGNGLARSTDRPAVAQFLYALMHDPHTLVVEVDRELLITAVERFARASDKRWGLVDCASFEIMNAMKLTDALTVDRHFEQAGFKPLLSARE